jgi:hypothetical protein
MHFRFHRTNVRLTFSSDGFQYPNAPRIKSTGAKQAAALINARRRYLVAAVLNSARVAIAESNASERSDPASNEENDECIRVLRAKLAEVA